MVAHAFNLSTQEVDTEQGYRKGEASLSYIPGQDSGVVVLQAMGTIKTSSEAGSVKAGTVSEPENKLHRPQEGNDTGERQPARTHRARMTHSL